MTDFYDNLETRSDDERANDLSKAIPAQLKNAKENSVAFKKILKATSSTQDKIHSAKSQKYKPIEMT